MHVMLIIKKPNTDSFQSYRSVSDLSFISKVIEKAATEQIQRYLQENNLYSSLQSAYRKYHSTETALVKVVNDLLLTVDRKVDAVLGLLDLSAAFKTIDHIILLERLQTMYSITNTALKWFQLYISDDW